MGDALCNHFFVDGDDGESSPFPHHADADDLFSILETWDQDCASAAASAVGGQQQLLEDGGAATKKTAAPAKKRRAAADDGSPDQKMRKCSPESSGTDGVAMAVAVATTPKSSSHIAVERNRRKQMNENLAMLRSLMPCFYVKRGDQASIIGGVVDYIKELQQVLHSLEAKKKRKVLYTDQVLTPRPPASSSSCCSPRPPISPRLPPQLHKYSTPPLSPRLATVPPISPCRTPPTPGSPYIPLRRLPPPPPPPPPSLDAIAAELCGGNSSRQQAVVVVPEVKVELAGANLVLRTVSQRSPGQAVRIIAALEGRSLEILRAMISTVDDTAVNSFTVKIGIECELSAEELVQEIQQTFT